MALTLEALHAAGHELTLVAPGDRVAMPDWCRAVLIPAPPRSLAAALLASLLQCTPLAVARHSHRTVRRAVEQELVRLRPDVIHAEQLQALAQCPRGGPPVVLRSQNVESDLLAGTTPWAGILKPLVRLEARRLARFEGHAVSHVAATVALSAADAGRLRALAGGQARIHQVPAPFPARLEPGPPLAGGPAVVVMGSAGWRPNRDGAAWFVESVWPSVRAALPEAQLHGFGIPATSHPGVVAHSHPDASVDAFPAGGVLVVPLWLASGVRMKILEAWARGVPVVATPAAAAGLEAADGRELLLADSAATFAAAIVRLQREPALADSLVAAGRRLLALRHQPQRVAEGLAEVYAAALGGPG